MAEGTPNDIVRNAVGINGAIIVAGSATTNNLYLMTMVTSPFMGRMTSSGVFLSDAEQTLVRDWIKSGSRG